MCKCKDIKMGDCTTQIPLKAPDWSRMYWISVDDCIALEIYQLWEKGITTYGCCCGHNIVESMVNVDDKDIEAMLKMEYVQNHSDKNRKDTFKLKSA